MKRLLIISLLISSCADESSLNQLCGNIRNQCYAVWNEDGYKTPEVENKNEALSLQRKAEDQLKKYGKLFGQCRMGTPTCDGDEIIGCNGAIYPSEKDSCDGIDNDCDGLIDEDAQPVESQHFGFRFPNEENPCIAELNSVQGICKYALIKCIDGQFTCTDINNKYYGIEPKKEISCDGIDNDCDGRVDEDLFIGESCYGPGDPDDIWDLWWTASNPPCHMGTKRCLMGTEVCANQSTPASDDICGDGIDNDCDGIIDNSNLVKATKIDYVFIVDRSGSMCRYYHNVAGATNMFVQTENPNHRYAIVETTDYTSKVKVISDFSDIETISSKLMALDCQGSPSEETYGGIVSVCNLSGNPLSLSWNPDAIPIILDFTDEGGQSFPPYNNTKQDAIDMCTNHSVLVFIWSQIMSLNLENLAIQTGGAFFEIVENTNDLFEDISSIVLWLCE